MEARSRRVDIDSVVGAEDCGARLEATARFEVDSEGSHMPMAARLAESLGAKWGRSAEVAASMRARFDA
jgi:hypothetical protein